MTGPMGTGQNPTQPLRDEASCPYSPAEEQVMVWWCWRWKPKRRRVLGCRRRPSRPCLLPGMDAPAAQWSRLTLWKGLPPAQPLGPSFSCKTSRGREGTPPLGSRARQHHHSEVIPPRHPEHIKHSRAQVPLCPLSFFSFPLIILLFCPRTFTPRVIVPFCAGSRCPWRMDPLPWRCSRCHLFFTLYFPRHLLYFFSFLLLLLFFCLRFRVCSVYSFFPCPGRPG